MSCGVDCRRVLDLSLLWLWRRPVATAPIQPLAWEPPHAAEAAQEIPKRQKKKKYMDLCFQEVVTANWEGEGVGWTGNLGLVDASIWSG